MKEDVLDVLMYLFQNYIGDDVDPDRDSMHDELLEAGFPRGEVKRAFDWLEGLAARQQEAPVPLGSGAFRIFTAQECERLDIGGRGFLMHLEQIGVLSPEARELVMDRVLALDTDDGIDGTQLKWLILMVLFNQPGQEDAYAWVEDLLLDEFSGTLH